MEKNLEIYGKKKFQILKKKFRKFTDFCGFLCFTERSLSRWVGSVFSYQSNWFIYKNRSVFLSELIYFRHNFQNRIKILWKKVFPSSLNIDSIDESYVNRFLYKDLFLVNGSIDFLTQFFKKL